MIFHKITEFYTEGSNVCPPCSYFRFFAKVVSLKVVCILNICLTKTDSVAQEPEGSSPHSQQPATGPCTEPVESNPHPQVNLPKIHSDHIFPPTPWSSKWSLSFGLSHQNLVHFSLLSHACHMSRPPHSP
jgi:hypothetical protein